MAGLHLSLIHIYFLIGGGRGWEYAPLKAFYLRFNNVDIRDDVQLGLALKAIEGHMGMDIQETEAVSYTHLQEYKEQENPVGTADNPFGWEKSCLLYTSRCV